VSDDAEQKVKIAHVLAMDIVGYSTLLITEQTRVIAELTKITRSTQRFRDADAQGKLIRIPTGDGMALVFFDDPDAPIHCAIEISAALKNHPEIPLRMGIHSGPVNPITDVNEQSNVAGAGIDLAQRVMDCGDAGHILLSKRVAEDYSPFPQWNPHLHDIGECWVKHSRRISLVNFFNEEVGNPALPQKCQSTPRVELPRRGHSIDPKGPLAAASGFGAIAVMPLVNMSGNAADEYFADGMTEALITDLAKIGGFKVISRGSVMGFKGTTRSRVEIGRELSVEAIVEGSVLHERDRIRISARLVRAEGDEYLWADRYDRELADVLALQDEVARAIAAAVGQTLRGAANATPRKVDPEVYLLDLRARHYWHQRTEVSFRSALQLFEEAVARDPTYAPAYVGMAESLNMLANYGIVPPAQIRARSLAAVRRALELDETLADAHRVLAFLHWQFEFAWDAAIAEYERALELDPHSPATTYWFGAYLGVIGFFERSYQILDRAQELDPLSLVVPSVQGWSRFFARRFDEAIPFYRQVLNIDPSFHLALWFLGEALVEMAQYEEGVAALERAYELAGRTSRLLGYLGYAYGRAGREDRARQSLAELDVREKHGYVPPYFQALVLSGLQENDRAIARLEEAYRVGDTMLRDLKADPHWDRMRVLPRFAALMRQMGYPETQTRAKTDAKG
jgi:TolB-like protein/Tfp pilus assembly protein PilF